MSYLLNEDAVIVGFMVGFVAVLLADAYIFFEYGIEAGSIGFAVGFIGLVVSFKVLKVFSS